MANIRRTLTFPPNYQMTEKFAEVLDVPVEYLYAKDDATARLRTRLEERSKQAHAVAVQWQQKLAARSSRFRLSPEAERNLRSLGYTGK